MRVAIAGIWVLASAGAAWGQAEGRVASLGFDGYYRTNCWTPLRVALRAATGENQKLKIIVVQEDLDRDPVSFVQEITLTGGEGARREQQFWTYFMPQPSGLPSTGGGQVDPAEMGKKLRVYLATAGGTRLGQLSTAGLRVMPLDGTDENRGKKLVLVVREQGSNPRLDAYSGAAGVTEDVEFVPVSPGDLPDNVVGYRSVDAVLWCNVSPSTPQMEPSIPALQEWVREGGRMVVMQDAGKCGAYSSGPFGQMLPVALDGDSAQVVQGEAALTALRELAETDEASLIRLAPFAAQIRGRWTWYDPWRNFAQNTFPLARAARVKPQATVELWADNQGQVPYVVRWRFGAGCVAWVAQDLGHPTFQGRGMDLSWYGWTRVWDRLFDWHNDTVRGSEGPRGLDVSGAKSRLERYAEGSPRDISSATLKSMDLPARGAALVLLAVFFFLVYWAVAGPGTYVALARKKLAALSWPAFGVCAVGATGLTVLMVGWILRGKPQAPHVSVVRIVPGEEAIVHSQVGLFIPRDGEQTIELRDADPRRESSIVAYPMHRKFAGDGSGFMSNREYEVAVPRAFRGTTDPPPGIRVPYRSTMKKFLVKWVGPWKGNITGTAKLVAAGRDPRIGGMLKNELGIDLQKVYLVYRTYELERWSDGKVRKAVRSYDQILYMPGYSDSAGDHPAWAAGETIDLSEVFSRATQIGEKEPRGKREVRGREVGFLAPLADWPEAKWHASLRGFSAEGLWEGNVENALLMLSIYDRIPPAHAKGEDAYRRRPELLRRAGRQFDVSSAIAAGSLVVLAARENAPLPYRLEVQGSAVEGEGLTFYQVIVPIDRSLLQPTSRPAAPATTQRSTL